VGYVGTLIKGQMGFININTLQSEFKARGRNGMLGVVYTLSRVENYQDNDSNPRIPYLPEKERNKGLAGFDRTHNFQTYWVYNLPFGKDERWLQDGFASKIFGGWQVNGIAQIMSGQPINIVQGAANNLNAGGSAQYPDLVKDEIAVYGGNLKKLPVAGADPNAYQYFDRSAFAAVNIAAGQTQRFGSMPRNPVRGPGFWAVDMGLFRAINLPRRTQLQVRVEALNVFNHANFANPGADISNAGTFGFITGTTGQAQERTIRFGARFSF
jgi:hypothetical protein